MVSPFAGASAPTDLGEQGLAVEVHGAPQDEGHYVGVVRDPKDFFKYEFYSLTSQDPGIQGFFKTMHRHDKIRVWGSLFIEGPQKHIDVTRAVFEEKTEGLGEYERQSSFPADFPGENVPFLALVHYCNLEKRVLVVEYKDVILPVRLSPELKLEDLYRNDLVEIKAKIVSYPQSPKHLMASAVVRKEAIAEVHGKPIDKTGVLVKFPKSSQVIFDVYAVQEILPQGLTRQYTVVSFDDAELFKKVRAKLGRFWDAGDAAQIRNARNKLMNPSVIVRIKGIANLVDRAQANPQIIVKNLEDVALAK